MNNIELEILKSKLPIQPGILRKEEYFNSAVLIPLIMINGEYNFLFEKRAANIRQGGEICFPGGEFDTEIDSSYKDTAIRETFEELGIDKKNISIIGILDTLIGPMGVTVDSFLGVLNIQDISSLKFDANEVEKIFLLPVSFFMKNEPEKYHVRMEINPTDIDKNGEKINTLPVKELQLPDRYSKTWRGRKHQVLVYKTEEGIIWGITAALINEIVLKLNS
ncbi:MAG: CoA pyrophosphatase [Bacteroidetes bacterium]|nr:CoA pyrophosphatase [Bacteroidota bacterium]